jgi:hypothetical protein
MNLIGFPLTPALSLRERENCSQRFNKATAVNCSQAFGVYQSKQRLFLLPWGEGRDEEESRFINS